MNILLTSVGRRSYIVNYFKEALGNSGKVVASNSAYCHALSLADAHYISPLIYDDEYIHFIVDVCKKEDIAAVLSLFDIDLPILAEHKSCLEMAGSKFIGPSYETAIIGNDKFRTHEFFRKYEIASPNTYFDLSRVIDLVESDRIDFPLIIKPRWGMGSIGVYIVRNLDELKVLYGKCKREIQSSYLKYESACDIDRAVLIQECISGQEYGLDVIKDLEGNYITTVVKKKIAMRSGETDVGETVGASPFLPFARTMADHLDFTGMMSVDCFLAGNELYGVEINCRISGHYPFSHLAGSRYPAQIVKWLEGGSTDFQLLEAEVGVKGCKELMPTIIAR